MSYAKAASAHKPPTGFPHKYFNADAGATASNSSVSNATAGAQPTTGSPYEYVSACDAATRARAGYSRARTQPVTRYPQQPKTSEPNPQTDQDLGHLEQKPSAEAVIRILKRYGDVSVAVKLVGKLETLLKQAIVRDIYITDNERNSTSFILNELENFRKKVKKEVNCQSNILGLLKEVLTDVDQNDFSKRYTLNQSDASEHEWFENKDTLEAISDGVQMRTLGELEQLALGLMHEYVSWIYKEDCKALIIEAERLVSEPTARDLDEQKTVRNWIVHCRTEHRFKDQKEQQEFLNFYRSFAHRLIRKEDLFLMRSEEKKSQKYDHYMEPHEEYHKIKMIIDHHNIKLEEKQPQKAEAAEDVNKTSDDTSASTEFAQEPKHENANKASCRPPEPIPRNGEDKKEKEDLKEFGN